MICRAPDKRGIEDNSKINFSYFSTKTYVMTPHLNRLRETILMMGSNIRLKELYGKLSLLLISSGALDLYLLVQLEFMRIRSCVPYTLSTDFRFRMILQG